MLPSSHECSNPREERVLRQGGDLSDRREIAMSNREIQLNATIVAFLISEKILPARPSECHAQDRCAQKNCDRYPSLLCQRPFNPTHRDKFSGVDGELLRKQRLPTGPRGRRGSKADGS